MDDETLEKRFELYLQNIRLKYETADEKGRENLVGDLEIFVGRVLSGQRKIEKTEYDIEQVKVELSEEEKEGKTFNKETAKKIRFKTHLTRRELGDYLDISESTLARYERKGLSPRKHVTRSMVTYLNWLKKVSGYNPFGV